MEIVHPTIGSGSLAAVFLAPLALLLGVVQFFLLRREGAGIIEEVAEPGADIFRGDGVVF